MLWNCYFNSFNFKNSCNLPTHKCKLPDDDIEMSKHVAVYAILRDTVVVYDCTLVGCNKNSKVIFACLSNIVESGRGLFTALL